MIPMHIQFTAHFLCGKAKTGDARHIFCTGAPAPLLSAPMHAGMQFYTIPYIKKTGSLGPVDLMTADAHKIYTHTPGLQS